MPPKTALPASLAWLVCVFIVFFHGCAAPVQELWPPQEGAPGRTIVVSLDTWHAMIAFALEDPQHSNARADSRPTVLMDRKTAFEEWGYAEQAWYLEGRRGITGAVRALFGPSQGVVEVGLHDRIWAARTPQPPSDVFVFRLSETGYQRLRKHLRATIAASEPLLTAGGSRVYPAMRSYHLFHQGHQYAALALREAGLPLSAA